MRPPSRMRWGRARALYEEEPSVKLTDDVAASPVQVQLTPSVVHAWASPS